MVTSSVSYFPTGKARVRFTGYIECGTQPQQAYQGKAKPPAPEVRLVFHVVGGKGKDEQGSVVDFVSQEDTEKGFFPRISPFFPMAIKGGDRAGSTKVWAAMNYAGDANNYVDLLIPSRSCTCYLSDKVLAKQVSRLISTT